MKGMFLRKKYIIRNLLLFLCGFTLIGMYQDREDVLEDFEGMIDLTEKFIN